ncbi:MAG TPA: DapH/DapD/GlmU-related protein [Acidimicrobiales bacterium]|nr:DapH/DapD/GlmU-related protein [Acidimicrobiales bacterium]
MTVAPRAEILGRAANARPGSRRAGHGLARLYRATVLNGLAASALLPNRYRWRLLRACGLDVSRCVIEPGLFVGGRDIAIGESSYLNVGVFLDNSAHISIGCRTMIGPQVMVLTSTHEPGPRLQRAARVTARPVRVGDGCWVGARAMVLPGVTIGDGCVIGAGSVVTRDCAPDGLYVGAPARRQCDLH